MLNGRLRWLWKRGARREGPQFQRESLSSLGVSSEKSPDSSAELDKSKREICISSEEIHISFADLCIFLSDLHISLEETPIAQGSC